LHKWPDRRQNPGMDRKLLATLVAILGVLIILVSALAEPLGLGEGGKFGWKQILGTVIGALLLVAGVVLQRVGPLAAPDAGQTRRPTAQGDTADQRRP
jgi:predicted transporter